MCVARMSRQLAYCRERSPLELLVLPSWLRSHFYASAVPAVSFLAVLYEVRTLRLFCFSQFLFVIISFRLPLPLFTLTWPPLTTSSSVPSSFPRYFSAKCFPLHACPLFQPLSFVLVSSLGFCRGPRYQSQPVLHRRRSEA